jgi:hypothetical protein
MKKVLLDILICPNCPPEAHHIQETMTEVRKDDIVEGTLR